MNKKIYFAGSIRGGRVDAALYQRIIQYINKTEVVLKQKKCAETVVWRTFLMIVNVKRITHVLADC